MDFHDFTSTEQFDKAEIFQLARLESLPKFKLIKREREYLAKYRELLSKELAARRAEEKKAKRAKKAEEPVVEELPVVEVEE